MLNISEMGKATAIVTMEGD